MAAGRLTRDWQGDTLRFKTDKESIVKYDGNEQVDHLIVDCVAALAKEKNVTRTQIALAWPLHQPQATDCQRHLWYGPAAATTPHPYGVQTVQ